MTSKRLNQIEIFIMALDPEKHTYIQNLPTKEKALAKLREKSGLDFGDDAEKWTTWFRKLPKSRYR